MKRKIRAFALLAAMAIIYIPAWAASQTINGVKWTYKVSGGKATIAKMSDGTGSVNIPSSVTTLTVPSQLGGYPVVGIDSGAIPYGTGLGVTKLIIPNSLTYIADLAFSKLTKVKTVIFTEGAGTVTIGDQAFAYDYGNDITSLQLREGVTSLGNRMIDGCSNLTKLEIPSTVNTLKTRAFYGSGLKNVIFKGNAPSSIGEKVFQNVGSGCTVWVKPGSKNWGVTIPGTWQGVNIKYLKAIGFDGNGGAVTADVRYVMDGETVGALPTPTKTEATFNGWFTAKSGGTQISASTTVSANTTFYANWTMTQYTVTFDANDGVGGTSKTQDWGTTIGTVAVPTRTGYIFKGWFTEASGGEKAEITESSKIECDKTYFAHWERDPIPEMVSGETVAEVLAGAADETLAAKLGTTRNYKNYRGWVDDKALEHKAVKESPNAWLAYALDAPGLIAKPSAVAKEDFTFEAGSSITEEPGKMAFDFGIDGVTIGEEAELDEVFVITGAATLEEGVFTESGVTALLERTSDGKVSVSVEPPKDGNGKIPDKYFFRVRVK